MYQKLKLTKNHMRKILFLSGETTRFLKNYLWLILRKCNTSKAFARYYYLYSF